MIRSLGADKFDLNFNRVGTPKTIREALAHGVEQYLGVPTSPGLINQIEISVRDFLSQKFSQLTLSDNPHVVDAAEDVWNQIFNSEFKAWTERPREDEGV